MIFNFTFFLDPKLQNSSTHRRIIDLTIIINFSKNGLHRFSLDLSYVIASIFLILYIFFIAGMFLLVILRVLILYCTFILRISETFVYNSGGAHNTTNISKNKKYIVVNHRCALCTGARNTLEYTICLILFINAKSIYIAKK